MGFAHSDVSTFKAHYTVREERSVKSVQLAFTHFSFQWF